MSETKRNEDVGVVPLEKQLREELDALRRELAALEAPSTSRTEQAERTERSVGVGPESPQALPRMAGSEVKRPPDWHNTGFSGWRTGPRSDLAQPLPSPPRAAPDSPLPASDVLIREPVAIPAHAPASNEASLPSQLSTSGCQARAAFGSLAPCPGQVALDPGPWQIPSWPSSQRPQLPARSSELAELRAALLAEQDLRQRLAGGLAEAAEAMRGFPAAAHLEAAATQLREARSWEFLQFESSVAATSRLLLERIQEIGRQSASGKRPVCTLAKPRKKADQRGEDEAVGCVVWGGQLASLNAELAKAEHALAAWQLIIGDATPCNPRISAWLGDSRPSVAHIPVTGRAGSRRTSSPMASAPIQVPMSPAQSGDKHDDGGLLWRSSEHVLDAAADADRPCVFTPPPSKDAIVAALRGQNVALHVSKLAIVLVSLGLATTQALFGPQDPCAMK
ncbi:unnamed protein product [Symbiodinium natans]|uniref:Uncharacterized protein n=1 Tax=Symbiodinium natans TaxID=878477 RepID=A0A812KB01_9DINO|nr:unnamed protein product [Symbiodinium natans]